MALAVKMGLAL